MTMRITDQMVYGSQARNLQSSLAALAAAQQRATTGLKLQRPSDDPAGAVTSLQLRAQQAQNTQYSRNITDGTAWTSAADAALSQTSTLIRQARDAVVQAGNGSLNQSALDALADQLSGIRDGLVAQANTTVGGRAVFAGTSDAGGAFDASYNFTGTAGSSVTRRIGDGQSVRVDVDGSAVYGQGATSLFAQLDGVIADLRAGNPVGYALGQLDAAQQAVGSAQAAVGSAEGQLQAAKSAQATASTQLVQRRSDVENVDIAQAAIDLTNRNNVYQAALLVVTNTMQNNLTDFLR
ncbi:flagellar hook-associated protein FlgL [Gryllotalpicola daejeonensis]|uniref:Flagellar hook-associated protein FlgL n=1 Tax=Gryllotalpicola daejeonensis TaxID=993087 RepID=A0ABP7ZHT2_9MICO